jgi:hypothetical protein
MMQKNMLCVIVLVLLFLALGYCLYMRLSNKSVESFTNVPLTHRVERIIRHPDGRESSHPMNVRSNFFTIPSNWQANLSPRFSNVDYGAHLRYQMPDIKYQAVPKSPMDYGDMVQEGYCGANLCNKDKQMPEYLESSDMIPVGDMKSQDTCNSVKSPANTVVYDRLVYSTAKNRTLEGADYFRGDLKCIPKEPGWFAPDATPNQLREGYFQGIELENCGQNDLHDFKQAWMDGTLGTFGGTAKNVGLGGSTDVIVTSFP